MGVGKTSRKSCTGLGECLPCSFDDAFFTQETDREERMLLRLHRVEDEIATLIQPAPRGDREFNDRGVRLGEPDSSIDVDRC